MTLTGRREFSMSKRNRTSKNRIIVAAVAQLMVSNQVNGMEAPELSLPLFWQVIEHEESSEDSQEKITIDGKGYVYRDGEIRRHLDEIMMIFKRCGFLRKDGTADLFKISFLDKQELRNSIRMTLEKAYMAHLLNAEDLSNLQNLYKGLKSWDDFKTTFDSESQRRLKDNFSKLEILLEKVERHNNDQMVKRYLTHGDIHWLSSWKEKGKSDIVNGIPQSFKLLAQDLSQSFGTEYIKILPIYKHSILAQRYHTSIFEKCSTQWNNSLLKDLFMELVQLKCSLNSKGNAEERRTFGDAVSGWFGSWFTESSQQNPLYCEDVRRIKGHIENLQAYILNHMVLEMDLNVLSEHLSYRYSPNYLFRDILTERKEIWILSLDGGGVRGKIATEILRNISRQLKERGIETPLSEIFHFLGGTSVGGLIVLALGLQNETGKPALNEEEIADLLEHEQASRIFPPTSQIKKMGGGGNSHAYSPKHLQRLLLATYGYGMLSGVGKPLMVMAHNNRTQKPTRFTNYDPKAKEISLWGSGMATSAACPYYPSTTACYNGTLEEFSDGGFTTNNPAADCLEEVINILRNRQAPIPRINLISIGTGKVTYNYPHGSFKTGLAGAVTNFSEGAMMKSVKDSHKKVLLHLQNLVKEGVDVSYYRINPHLKKVSELDNSACENLAFLAKTVKKTVFPSPEYTIMIDHLAGNGEMSRNKYIGISRVEGKYRTIN